MILKTTLIVGWEDNNIRTPAATVIKEKKTEKTEPDNEPEWTVDMIIAEWPFVKSLSGSPGQATMPRIISKQIDLSAHNDMQFV